MSKKIIICDDDEGIREVCRIVLEEKGYEVYPLSNGNEVLKEVPTIQPALVILDLSMPGPDGTEVTKKLKANPDTSSIPVIISSASRNTEASAREAGADDFISKPFDIADLETLADKYCK